MIDDHDYQEQEPWNLADELAKHGWHDSDSDDLHRYSAELQDMARSLAASVDNTKRRTVAAVQDILNGLGKQVFDSLKAMQTAINAQADVIDTVRADLARIKAGPPELGELPPWAVAFRERLLAEVATIWTNGSATLTECLRAEMQNQGHSLAGMIHTLSEQLQKAFSLVGQQEDSIAHTVREIRRLQAEVFDLKARQERTNTDGA